MSACTIHDHAAPVRSDFIDFPTGWRIQCEGLTHTDERCSAVQTGGAMLCDCDALRTEWERRVNGGSTPNPTEATAQNAPSSPRGNEEDAEL